MKKTIFLFICFLWIENLHAQEIKVTPYSHNSYNGYAVELTDDGAKADEFMSIFFKGNGKVRKRAEIYTISDISRADFPFPEVLVYSMLIPKGRTTKAVVWMEDSLIQQEEYSKKLNELWYSFGLEFYRYLAQQEIDESTQALRFAERQFQKLERDSLGLKNDLLNNEQEKIKLEEALKTNDLNNKVLHQKIIDNKAAKDSLLITIDKIRKLIELQEEKKRAIQ